MELNKPAPKIPRSGPEREALQVKGQFWTPDWVAQAMVAYVALECDRIFDPAFGAGAFLRAAREIERELNKKLEFSGAEIDPQALSLARDNGIAEPDLAAIKKTDFLADPSIGPLQGIVANPPYLRHHRLSAERKARLKFMSRSFTGLNIDGRAGLHVYFLLRALQLLEKKGRLAFIMPSDTFEGVFAGGLWRWITSHYRLDAVITFHHDASPFPEVDTNPVIVLIENSAPAEEIWWAKIMPGTQKALKAWVRSGFSDLLASDITIRRRKVEEGTATGFSREPQIYSAQHKLGDFARVMRGIATGANDFFFLTRTRASDLKITPEFLVPAIGRTRDVPGAVIDHDLMKALEEKGRPTLLFSPDGRALPKFPAPVRKYLQEGEQRVINNKTLIATRNPWYKMETRSIPPILFAYLGRRRCRFILNKAGVVPLTCLMCIYPDNSDPVAVKSLWEILNHNETIEGLALVGKSYGS
ncbi:MAG TPA: N-6 DNA methylase, partial [bacterium]|nr:N-6 DNA methylase [bacterium]